MKSIIENSSFKRVFYFSGFIYFIPAIKKIDEHQIDSLVYYILDLLIFFDEILIPSEHLVISNNDLEYNFKVKFLSDPIIQQLIESNKIVTTIWSACNDSIQHYEVMDRYMNVIEAKQYYYFEQIKPYILNISIYQRNAIYQSNKAKNYTNEKKYYDELLYEDNSIIIGFSHEKLLLGKSKNKIIDAYFIKSAKEAYIKAMPDGNGRVYRSLIHNIEEIKFQNTTQYIPINKPSDVNPILLTYKYYTMLLYKIGFRRNNDYRNPNWIKKFLSFTKVELFQNNKEEFFNILEYLTTFSLRDDIEVKYAIESIYIKKINFDFTAIIFNNIHKIIGYNTSYKKIFYIKNDFINEYNNLKV